MAHESQTPTGLTHIDQNGAAQMVDVSAKNITQRIAVARARVSMQAQTLDAIREDRLEKGEVLGVARIAGIQGAKKCADLIPLCHPLALSKVSINFSESSATCLEILAEVKVSGTTGVEMEALTAVSVAALTVYDMCKAIDKGMTISNVALLQKEGGKSGSWQRNESDSV